MHPIWVVAASAMCFGPGMHRPQDDKPMKFADCPLAVRNTFLFEGKNSKIESVTREKGEDGETVYWADVVLKEKTYAMGVLEDGTLSEMNLAVEERELPLDKCPLAVQEAFKKEAFGEHVDTLAKDRKYGMTIYETVVDHKGKSYEIIVAEDGTLVEKVLIIDDEEIELAKCPPAVQAAFHEQARGGKIHEITRSSGISKPTYEAEVEIKNKVYLIEIDEAGLLLAKSLEATAE